MVGGEGEEEEETWGGGRGCAEGRVLSGEIGGGEGGENKSIQC